MNHFETVCQFKNIEKKVKENYEETEDDETFVEFIEECNVMSSKEKCWIIS